MSVENFLTNDAYETRNISVLYFYSASIRNQHFDISIQQVRSNSLTSTENVLLEIAVDKRRFLKTLAIRTKRASEDLTK